MINKKILFVVNVDWFFISHRLPLALEALKRGYRVDIACGITNKKEYLESFGFNIHNLNISRSGTSLANELKLINEIYRLINKINPEVIHFITIKPVLYGGIASRFLNIRKKVFSISGLGFIFINKGIKASIIRFIIKMMYSVAFGGKNSHVIVQNKDDKNIIRSIKKLPITLIRGSGVDLNQYAYKSENNDTVKVTMACRLLRDKGVFEYIGAVKILKNKGYNIEYELYGDIDIGNPATLTSNDLIKIKDEGLISLYGFSNSISNIFSKTNIVVLPSYREGLPKVLIEAAACGRAVVTTNVPGCRDAIEKNTTGLLCELKDSESLANEIEKLILDINLRNNMGKAGRVLAEKEFNIANVVKKHFDIYEEKI